MRRLVIPMLVALAAAQIAGPAAAQYARPAQTAPAMPQTTSSTLLPNNGGVQLADGERVTVAVDAAGALTLVSAERLGFNAVAPGPGGAASVVSTAQPGTVVYSLQGPILKIENGLATAFNYSAVASLDINGQLSSQNVKTCTVLPQRAAFEMWSATVKITSVVVGAPVAYAGTPGCT